MEPSNLPYNNHQVAFTYICVVLSYYNVHLAHNSYGRSHNLTQRRYHIIREKDIHHIDHVFDQIRYITQATMPKMLFGCAV